MRRDFADALGSSEVNIVRDYINLFEFMWDPSLFGSGFMPMGAWDVIDGFFAPDFFGDISMGFQTKSWIRLGPGGRPINAKGKREEILWEFYSCEMGVPKICRRRAA